MAQHNAFYAQSGGVIKPKAHRAALLMCSHEHTNIFPTTSVLKIFCSSDKSSDTQVHCHREAE